MITNITLIRNKYQVGSTVANQTAVRRTQNQTYSYHNQQQPQVTQNCGYNNAFGQNQSQGQQMQQKLLKSDVQGKFGIFTVFVYILVN